MWQHASSAVNLKALSLLRSGLLALFAVMELAHADVSLPRLLGDGVVLQRDKPVRIWGWADEGEQVTVQFAQQRLTTRARSGHWQLIFKPVKTGQTYQISVQGKNRITLHDVQIGDVWITSGQSNMELPISLVASRYPDLIQTTDLPLVREFFVPVIYSFDGPQKDFPTGQWKTATPGNLPGFSAVGFFYARSLYQQYHIPIGLISIATGGSPAESWMSEQALLDYPDYLARYKKLSDPAVRQQTISDENARVAAWYAKANSADPGLPQGWNKADFDDTNWPTLTVPGLFHAQQIDFSNGVIWLRKTVTLSQAAAQLPAQIFLGAMVDGDEVWINDQAVGSTTYQYPMRVYPLAANVLHAGRNSIAIRLTSYSSGPGFVRDKLYALQLGIERLSLEGAWHYRIGMQCGALPETTTLHYQPETQFNAKLAPVLHTAIRGVIWYQGESNTGRPKEYATLFPAMIRDWRHQFGQGDFPFLYVQLANFMEAHEEPTESNWAQTRQAQREALAVKNTGMAVAIDVGEWNDIHPLNKQDVGERLGLLARKISYGEHDLIASGPLAIKLTKRAAGLLVHFEHSASPLLIKGKALTQIAIAGEDHQFHWAEARIIGDALLVWNAQVANPRSVRYAWADNPAGANLFNAAGLPASPFELSLSEK
ncbi:sialate O-acetylesterase [Oxalobacteraceae bacterium GrIS 2.11]